MGTLYGIGVGPGDPELMTIKAVRLIQESDVIAIPASGKTVNVAYSIAKGAVPGLEEKPLVEVDMPMTREPGQLEESHRKATEQVDKLLKEGNTVAFLTLGDPTIYSTYIYIHDRIKAMGHQTRIISGIPSFCAVAARLGEGLTEASEALHIIPASYEGRDAAMELQGTKVLMKSGNSIGKVREALRQQPNRWEAKMVERCGMEGEQVFSSAEEIPETSSYFSIVVVKDK